MSIRGFRFVKLKMSFHHLQSLIFVLKSMSDQLGLDLWFILVCSVIVLLRYFLLV